MVTSVWAISGESPYNDRRAKKPRGLYRFHKWFATVTPWLPHR